MRIHKNSIVEWLPAGIFTTSCESKVTYWPLDTQECDLIITSWAYTSLEIILGFSESEGAIVTSAYQEHGKWELIGKSNKSETITRESQLYTRLIFTLTFRRRPLFHILNTIFPVVLMGFLTVTLFKLSPESGERVRLALTILLAYAVYLSLISDSIPQTSLSASMLSTYLATILLLQTIAVLLTVIYLDMYLTPDDEPVPNWLQIIMASSCKRKTTKVADASEDNKDVIITTVRDIEIDETEIRDDENKEMPTRRNQCSWKEIVLFCDKITLYTYLVIVTVLTVVFVAVMANHYNSVYSRYSV